MSPAEEQTPSKGSDCEPADLAQVYQPAAPPLFPSYVQSLIEPNANRDQAYRELAK